MKTFVFLVLFALEPSASGEYAFRGGMHKVPFDSMATCNIDAYTYKNIMVANSREGLIIDHMCLKVDPNDEARDA